MNPARLITSYEIRSGSGAVIVVQRVRRRTAGRGRPAGASPVLAVPSGVDCGLLTSWLVTIAGSAPALADDFGASSAPGQAGVGS